MFVVLRSPQQRLIALGVSLVVFLIIYFVAIKPNNDTANRAIGTANQALTQGERQINQSVNQANQQSRGAVPASVTTLTACLASAGTDATKIQSCDTKFKP